MKIIKLGVIDSTNSFLKEMAKKTPLENHTVALAKSQFFGRGQQASKWQSEPYKNLTFSFFCRFDDLKIMHQKYLNFAVSLAIFKTLKHQKIAQTQIKWPNDILSKNKKICGILIENSLKNARISSSIIGIGLNVNQEKFPNDLPNATSMKNCTKINYNLDEILHDILKNLTANIQLLNQQKFSFLETQYLAVLHKKGVPSMFKNHEKNLFMGIILGVSSEGKLQIQLENKEIQEFGVKEVSFC